MNINQKIEKLKQNKSLFEQIYLKDRLRNPDIFREKYGIWCIPLTEEELARKYNVKVSRIKAIIKKEMDWLKSPNRTHYFKEEDNGKEEIR